MTAKVPFEQVKIKLTHRLYFQLGDRYIGLRRSCWIYEFAVAFDGIAIVSVHRTPARPHLGVVASVINGFA